MSRGALRGRIDTAYSRLPFAVRDVIHRARLRIRAGQLTADDWASRPASDAQHYWKSIDQPYRTTLIEQLQTFGSPRSLLELGSHSGPNLRLAARAFPRARVGGIEINAGVVAQAQRLLREDDLDRVELRVGSVLEILPTLPEKSEDLVFSCFALAYMPPAQLTETLCEAVRVARLGLVLVEPHAQAGRAGLMRETAGWRHDYVAALTRAGVDGSAIRMVALPDHSAPLNGCLVADLRRLRDSAQANNG